MVNFKPLELSEQDKEYLKTLVWIRNDMIKPAKVRTAYFEFPVIPYENSRKVVNPLNVYGSQDD